MKIVENIILLDKITHFLYKVESKKIELTFTIEAINEQISITNGEFKIEFVQPLGESGEFYEFLKKTGGLHHIAVEVDDLASTLDTLKQKNIKMKDNQPKRGSQNSLVAFSEKESFDGVVFEFKQLNEFHNS